MREESAVQLRGDAMRQFERKEPNAAMAIVIRDTTVVTVDRNDTIHHNAAVAVEGGRIVAVGPSAEIAARQPMLCLYNAGSGEQVRQFTGHMTPIRALAFAGDGKLHGYHWGLSRKRAMLAVEAARAA